MKPGSGRKPRLTEAGRSINLALVKLPPPGKAREATLATTGRTQASLFVGLVAQPL